MKTPIYDMVQNIANSAEARFCMPGHKGKETIFGGASRYDITELLGADNLYMPQGVIKESEELHAGFIGAKKSFFLVNGASAGIVSSVLSILEKGDKVIAVRDFHLSFVSALALSGAEPVFISPKAGTAMLPGVVTPSEVLEAVRRHPGAKALFLTYPNYYGLCSDINEITAIARDAGMYVICDGAHSAMFDYSSLLPASPAQSGCDVFTTSLHKTLPALSQCAVLSTGSGTALSSGKVKACINMVQTTSPSYLLLASADYALSHMREEGNEAIARIVNIVEENIRMIEALGGYECVTKDIPRESGAYDRDILRLVIDVSDRGVSGFSVARLLSKHGIHVETADLFNVVLICSIFDTAEDFEKLRAVLGLVKGSNYNVQKPGNEIKLPESIAQQGFEMEIREAVFSERKNVRLEKCIGRISAVPVGAYPPGVPIILPGQVVTRDMIDYIIKLKEYGYTLFGCDNYLQTADV